MKTTFQLKTEFPVSAQIIYDAWLDSTTHSEMTGGEANCSNLIGDSFTAWDGYISGKNIKLQNGLLIIQSWRTTEFNAKDEDSILTIQLKDTQDGCELILIHENIPEGQSNYETGWQEHYFEPMGSHFV